jgi:N-acyl-D-amino-acid deacylase
MLDYFIINGLVFDGSGFGPVETNIGVKEDRIAYIGSDELPAKEIIYAKGLVVSPGFIDTHAHSEFTILADGRAEGKISQGVTTEINGNCGLSAAPLYNEARERREEDLKELGIKERWTTFKEYFDILQNKGIAMNFATLCGHGNIRASVIGYKDIGPDENEMNEMKRLLSDAAKHGAKGISTGLIYPPGVYSNIEELIELCKDRNPEFIYASHMRSEGDRLIEAIEEAVRIGRDAGVKTHISHVKTAGEKNWHKADKAIELMEGARNSGVRLTCDRYPYIAASTDLDAILPAWVYEGGVEEELKRLKDKDIAKRIKAEIGARSDSVWQGIYVSSVLRDENKWIEGENLFDIAIKMEKSPVDAAFEIIIGERARAGAIFFSMNEDNLKRFLSLPYAMIGSDSSVRSFSGPTRAGKPHPRAFGTFPRFIGRYARDEKLMPLSEAIRKMTSLPAGIFNLKERGIIKEGFYADITIFDYEKINDTATFKEPFKTAEGINYVFVNGTLAFKNGEFTGSRSGRVLS